MKVLLIGSGGREHAIAHSLLSSSLLGDLKVFPGNAGFDKSHVLTKEEIDIENESDFLNYLSSSNTDFVIVGPEDPLVNGLSDWCEKAGVPCFGPSAFCAQIEGSKHFAKQMMKKANVPTASFEVFTDYKSAWDYCKLQNLPLVIKADGLAAGKGVTVAIEISDAEQALDDIFLAQKFGSSGEKVVIESFLEGEEASLFVVTDGEHFICLPAAQDHKRAFDGDTGPNTGGMGAYAPAPIVTQEILKSIENTIIDPILSEFRNSGHPYKGLLYVGLMISKSGKANVVEFNCRFGDPETQCVLRLLDEDVLRMMYDASTNSLQTRPPKIKPGASAVVVLAAKGYPDSPKKGIPLDIPANEGDVLVFHAGTKRECDHILSSGGRILGITAVSDNLKDTMRKCYNFLDKLKSNDIFFRKDIGARAL